MNKVSQERIKHRERPGKKVKRKTVDPREKKDPAEEEKRKRLKEKLAEIGILSFQQIRDMMLVQHKDNYGWEIRTERDLSGVEKFSEYCFKNGFFQVPNQEFVLALASHLQGKKVLEIGAGNGVLAVGLRACGVDIIATDDLSWEESGENALYLVEDLDYKGALEKYGDRIDVVICSWMPRGEDWMPEIFAVDPRKVIAIGELGHEGTYGTGKLIERTWEGDWTNYPGRRTKKLTAVSKYSTCHNDTYANSDHSYAVSIEKIEEE